MRPSWALPLVLVAGCAASYKRPSAHALPGGIRFAGTWDSTWGVMVLQQDASHVHGTFTGYREGGLTGRAEGDLFRFVWDQRQPRSHGHGYMQLSADGSHLEGRWGYVDEDADGGRWAADRSP